MPIPTVIKHTDPGVSQLTGEVGSAYNIFKHCMPLAGWTIAFDDPANFKIVFRNNPITGSGCYVRILDDGSHSLMAARAASIRVYEDMTDVDTGINPCLADDTESWFKKSHTANNTARDWFFIADDRTVYFGTGDLGNTNGGFSPTLFTFGDYESSVAGMPGCYQSFFGAFNTSTSYQRAGSSAATTSDNISVSRSPSTLLPQNTKTNYYQSCFAKNTSSGSGIAGHDQYTKADWNNYIYFPGYIFNTAVGALYGVMRGIVLCLSNLATFSVGSIQPHITPSSMYNSMILCGQSYMLTGNTQSGSIGALNVIIDKDWDDSY